MIWPFSLWFEPEPFNHWPSRNVTFCFREMVKGNRFPFPEEYRELVRECAAEWTENTVINLFEGDFFDDPQPQIVISFKPMRKFRLGFGYFPGKSPLCGDIDIAVKDWRAEETRAYFKAVILHEFGHALGLKHSSSIHSLMYRIISEKEIHRFDRKNLNQGYKNV